MAGFAVPFTGTSRYELRRPLGHGGFGVVYEALDRETLHLVALKLLQVPWGERLRQFKDEFRLLRDVTHENLVTLFELRNDDPSHVFFTMELVDGGQTILSYVRPPHQGGSRRDGTSVLDIGRLRGVLPQLAGALTELHRHGLVHRDIKPSNVLVTPEGRVVVLDFGIVWALERDGTSPTDGTGPVLGTGAYIAPERASADGSTPAADWYSVGVILYEALTGRQPFEGDGFEQFRAKQTERPRPPHEIDSHVDREWSDVCMGLLERDPHSRLNGSALAQLFGAAPEAPVDTDTVEDDLLERDRHLESLADAFEATRRGQAVVALVAGRSGMGKTALVKHYLADQRKCEQSLLTLRGRCYERESMPYKAIDPIVDALSRYLHRLPDAEVEDLVPRDAAILTRVFPSLLEVDAFARVRDPHVEVLDSATMRHRASAALRELLTRIAVAVPLVIAIDDAQWGDADSAAILPFVLRPPDAPRLLLIAAYRSEDAATSPLVAALTRLVQEPDGPQLCQLDLDPLSQEEACRLAARLAGAIGRDPALAESIARESGGSPFFVHELARHAVRTGGATRLEDVVRDRVLSFPESTRLLMSAVALSAQPIPQAVAEAAASIGPRERSMLPVLTIGRLVRSPATDDVLFEPYHDRIREAVVGQLSPEETAACHLRLAEAWEQSGRARPDTLATHYAGAGDASRASVHAEKAADLAEHALAFDRAAEFYKLLLRLNAQPERRRQWLIGLGDAQVNDGRGHDGAITFYEALKLTDPTEALELESRAAAELIRAGYLGEATAALERLLPKVGVRPPSSHAQAILTLLGYRLLIGLRGIGIRERPESQVPRELLHRIDVLVAIGAPLSLVALPRGLSLNMQATWHALRAGERRRAALGLALLAATSSMRGTRTRRTTMRFVSAAKELAATIGDDYTTARTLLAEGISLKVMGQFKPGIECLERAIELFLRCPGSRWEIETAQTLIHDALLWTGEWKRLASELPRRRHEAEQHGDRYSVAHVAGRLTPLISLVADRPAQAQAEAEAAATHWAARQDNQARASLSAWLDIDLYAGEPERAAARLEAAWPSVRGMLSLFQGGRIEALTHRARIALALAARGNPRALKKAADAARRLEREDAEWASAFAVMVRAGIAQGRGDKATALELIEEAQQRLGAADMRMYAAAATFRRGQMLGEDAGRALVAEAIDELRSEQVVAPLRMVELLCPGPWGVPC